ncbi:MAG: NYN domain-containing protein [Spirochaetia bacterium]
MKQSKLAVLIDADNAQPSIIDGLMEEIAKYGIASVKRIYGDWTNTSLSGWKQVLLDYAIQPIQQFSYTSGKNSTDNAMIIDAMDLLYTEKLEGFCIVSSDSDFTRLAMRVRQSGLKVYGFGEKKTPKSLVAACDKFIFTEILRKENAQSSGKKTSAKEMRSDTRLVHLLRTAVEDSADDDGWASLSVVGQNLANKASEFDPRNYGYKKLGELMRAIGLFDIDARKNQQAPGYIIYVRDKRKGK